MKSSHHEDWQELWVLLLKQSEFFPSDESIAIKVKLMKPFLHHGIGYGGHTQSQIPL
jgi:hypothetical protein